jgi:hypothetical protein
MDVLSSDWPAHPHEFRAVSGSHEGSYALSLWPHLVTYVSTL